MTNLKYQLNINEGEKITTLPTARKSEKHQPHLSINKKTKKTWKEDGSNQHIH